MSFFQRGENSLYLLSKNAGQAQFSFGLHVEVPEGIHDEP